MNAEWQQQEADEAFDSMIAALKSGKADRLTQSNAAATMIRWREYIQRAETAKLAA